MENETGTQERTGGDGSKEGGVKEVYSIGEQEPFRLTKDSGYRLALAICMTGAEVISATVDTTCPPIHICVRVRIAYKDVDAFCEHFQNSIDPVEVAGGQG